LRGSSESRPDLAGRTHRYPVSNAFGLTHSNDFWVAGDGEIEILAWLVEGGL